MDLATEEFGRRLALVGPSSWGLPTPCSLWDVHDLAAHVLDGMAASDAIERVMSSPQVGNDVMEAWKTTSAT
ncbi:MAG: maleylpyruvate isomerase N-terminal domain-containing protein [Acidimicrobiales bacterium]